MKRRTIVLCASILGMTLLTAPINAQKPGSGSQINMTVWLYSSVVDEQDTNAFYSTSEACPHGAVDDLGRIRGDRNELVSAYAGAGFGSFWQPFPTSATAYTQGTSCDPSTNVCLGVKLINNAKTLSMDTRGTAGPRKATIDFSVPCLDCALPGEANKFGNPSTPFWMSVFLTSPFTSMAVCSSRACREAQSAYVKLWFNDPAGDPQVMWLVDWPFVRVLRMATNNWYIIANGCDGSWTATLSRLHKNQKRVQGSYVMPFFASTVPAP